MKFLKIIKGIEKEKKGSSIAYALVVIVMVSIVLTSVVQFIASQTKNAYRTQSREEAFQIAEAGVNFYRWYLAHQTDGKTSLQIKNFWEGTGANDPLGLRTKSPYIKDYYDKQGGKLGTFSIVVTAPDVSSTIVTAEVSGWTDKYPDTKRKIKVRFRRPSWSENSVLANDDIRFGQGTTVNGKIHSNGGVRFDGVATNVISSSKSSYDDPDHNESGTDKLEFGVHTHVNAPPSSGVNDAYRPNEVPPATVQSRVDVFKAGRKFPVTQIDFASLVSDISYMRSQTLAANKYDNKKAGVRIILKSDGNYDSCKVNSYSKFNPTDNTGTSAITDYVGAVVVGATTPYTSDNGKSCSTLITTACCNSLSTCEKWISSSNHAKGKCASMQTKAIPSDGIIFVANNVWLEGTVSNKKITIVAAELSDESGYTGGAKNVFLGMNNLLYTNTDGKDIIGVIAQEDVEVIKDSLNVLTINGAFLAKDGRVGRNYYGGTRSTITVNGSIGTYARYGFAYTDGTGYQIRNLNFDNNLLYYPPPYFPTGTQYAVDLWEEL